MLSILLTCWIVALGGDAWVVELANGHEYEALRADRDGEHWVLGFEQGEMRIAVADVRSVTKFSEQTDPGKSITAETEARPPTQLASQRELQPIARLATSRTQKFQLHDATIRTALPDGYQRSEVDDDAVVSYLDSTGKRSVRFAWATADESIWKLGRVIKKHHRSTYRNYRTHSERFSGLGDRPAWLLTFSYQKGKVTWFECQGFLEFKRGILVISVSVPSDGPDPATEVARQVRSIARATATEENRAQ